MSTEKILVFETSLRVKLQKLEHQRFIMEEYILRYSIYNVGDVATCKRYLKTMPLLSQRIEVINKLVKPARDRYN